MEEKENVTGIILVLSCQKHVNTRLVGYKLKKNNYENWKVIYVLGNLFLDTDYKLENDLLTIKTEDSYIHLLKKLVLSIKILHNLYNIEQGILRCGDDLIFNETNLVQFLNMKNKPNYLGTSPSGKSLLLPDVNELKVIVNDNFMVDYYTSHQEDFSNPQHNLSGVDIRKYISRPKVDCGAWGALYYLSNHSCKVLIDKMEEVQYNIFHYDEFSNSYPYTIEDCAVSFILYLNGIGFTHVKDFVLDRNEFTHIENNVAISTNEYK